MSVLINESYVNEKTSLWQPSGAGTSPIDVIAADETSLVSLTSTSYYPLFTVVTERRSGVYTLQLTANIQGGSTNLKTITLQMRDTGTGTYYNPYPSINVATNVPQQLSSMWTFKTNEDPANPVKLQVYAATNSIVGGAPSINCSFVLTYCPIV